MADEQRFVIRPEDREGIIAGKAMWAISEAAKGEVPVEIIVKPYRKRKTPPQHRTIWMWHGEVASQLTEMGRQNGVNVVWSNHDVHEIVFKPRYMPQRCKTFPNGREGCRYGGLSDPETTAEETSTAMEAYLAWIYSRWMEVTIPDDPETQRIVGGMR